MNNHQSLGFICSIVSAWSLSKLKCSCDCVLVSSSWRCCRWRPAWTRTAFWVSLLAVCCWHGETMRSCWWGSPHMRLLLRPTWETTRCTFWSSRQVRARQDLHHYWRCMLSWSGHLWSSCKLKKHQETQMVKGPNEVVKAVAGHTDNNNTVVNHFPFIVFGTTNWDGWVALNFSQ